MSLLTPQMIAVIENRIENEGREYRSCSRRPLRALQACFDFIGDDIIHSSVALAGGGARASIGSCGVFSAGLMALSLRFCPRSNVLSKAEIETLDKARELFCEYRDWFMAEFGSIICRDVQMKLFGRYFNFMDDDDIKAFQQSPERLKCNDVGKKGTRKVAEILSRFGSIKGLK